MVVCGLGVLRPIALVAAGFPVGSPGLYPGLRPARQCWHLVLLDSGRFYLGLGHLLPADRVQWGGGLTVFPIHLLREDLAC